MSFQESILLLEVLVQFDYVGRILMSCSRIWMTGGSILVAIWIIAFGGIWFVRSQKMTAAKTLDYIAGHSLQSHSEAERMRIINALAGCVNQLSFEERQKVRFEKSLRSFYAEMTEAERSHYLDLTLPNGMKKMMEAFNAMAPEKRKQLVDQAKIELARIRTEAPPEQLEKAMSDQNLKKIIDQGLKSYLSDANAATKLEIQPLIEQMQSMLQTGR